MKALGYLVCLLVPLLFYLLDLGEKQERYQAVSAVLAAKRQELQMFPSQITEVEKVKAQADRLQARATQLLGVSAGRKHGSFEQQVKSEIRAAFPGHKVTFDSFENSEARIKVGFNLPSGPQETLKGLQLLVKGRPCYPQSVRSEAGFSQVTLIVESWHPR